MAAKVELNILSYYLGKHTSISVLLPEKFLAVPQDLSDKKYPVLYLLHGLTDDYQSYLSKSIISELAADLDLIVVMPDADRSCYANAKQGSLYYDYLTKELPLVIANCFHASTKREDTYIAGISMGGYGACMIAMRNPEKFCAVASLSGTMDMAYYLREEDLDGAKEVNTPDKVKNFENIFGSAQEYDQSDYNLYRVLEKLKKEGCQPLKYFQCVGTEDNLLNQNRRFCRAVQEVSGIEHLYKEAPGNHHWFFWNKALADTLRFFGFEVSEMAEGL